MPAIRKLINPHIALFITGLMTAAAIRSYRTMFNEHTWDWGTK